MGQNELWFFVLGAVLTVVMGSSRIEDEWRMDENGSATFNHMVMDVLTGKLYVAAVNKLFVFDDSLEFPYIVQTGPHEDNMDCPPLLSNGSRPCNETLSLTPVYSKGLVIDYENNRLIACTNLYHGTCVKHYLDNVLWKEQDSSRYVPIVGNAAKASTVIFIAPGPLRNKDGDGYLSALYVGSQRSRSSKKSFSDIVPDFASRKLSDFGLVHDSLMAKSEIKSDVRYRDTFPVYYKYGFGSDGFSYMVQVQKESTVASNFISKLSRVCQQDKHFYSYTEVKLQCEHDGEFYNLAQAAHVGRAGSILAQKLGVAASEDVLYVVFAKGSPNTVNPTAKSVICLYPMRHIRKTFTENIQECFKGSGNTGPDYVTLTANCIATQFNISDDYCGDHDVNYPIDGTRPVSASAAAILDTTASALTVVNEATYTVALVGTADGHLLKVILKSQSEGVVYDDITLDEGSKINADMFMDNAKKFLFVLSDIKVMKVNVLDWRKHPSCAECKGVVDDPYCDLCSQKGDTTDGAKDGTSGTNGHVGIPLQFVFGFILFNNAMSWHIN